MAFLMSPTSLKVPIPLGILATIVVLFLTAASSCYGSNTFDFQHINKNVQFSHLDSENILPHPTINAIVQDSTGYIWIATQGGLVKYNGINSKVYTHDVKDSGSISNNWINALYADSAGRLWIASEGGIHLYVPESDSFINFNQSQEHENLKRRSYLAIAEDNDGNLWFASKNSGLTKYDVSNAEFVAFNSENSYLSSNYLIDIKFDGDGRLWVATRNSHLNIYDPVTNDFHQADYKELEDKSLTVLALFVDKSNRLWIGTEANGLLRYDVGNTKLVKSYKYDRLDASSICDNSINAITQDSSDRIWIASTNGLCMYNEASDRFVRHTKNLNRTKSLINNRVLTIAEDRGGVIWVGTQNGISYWNASLNYFNHITQQSEYGQLSSSSIMSFAASEDKIYVGTWEGGLNIIDQQDLSIRVERAASGSKGKLTDNNIMSLLIDSNKGLWVGTFSQGIFYKKSGARDYVNFKYTPDKETSLSNNAISKLIELDNGKVAVATYGGGLNIIDGQNQSVSRINMDTEPNENQMISLIVDVTEDSDGIIWLATRENGLGFYDRAANKFTQIIDPETKLPAISTDVFSIISDEEFIWAATADVGVVKIDRKKYLTGNLAYTTIGTSNGLASNLTYGLIKANDSTIWVSHSKGLSRITPNTTKVINFNTSQGLQGTDFNSSAYYKAPNGQLFFGGTNGFNTFMPDSIPINTYKPPLRLTKFSHANIEKPIHTLLREDGVLELNHKETILDFEFAALDYTKPANNRYQYMIEGLSDVWINLGTNNHISFSYLADGDYKLRVRGSNNELVWSDEIVIPIEVLPPVWFSWYAYITYVLISVLAVLSILRQQQIKHQRQLSHERRLHHLAYYDSLTGLPNRQSFYENLEKFISLARRGNYQAGVMFIDLDRFKRINDTLGHDYGDKVLQEVAIRLKESVRDSDIVARNYDVKSFNNEIARLGGDEFTLFLSHIESAEETSAVTQRIIDSLSQPIKIDNYELTITPSIGIAMYPENGNTVNELMKHADIAMYQAKEDGRRTFKFYSNASNDRALERLQLEEYMRSAVANQGFQLYYQPQVDLEKNSITKAEALIRWFHPELGFIPPDDFISIAEESGIIIELGDWILDTACLQAKAWMDAGIKNCRVSVNVSSVQFKQSALIDKVKSALSKSQLPPHLLELELTESAVMSDVEDNIERLQQFKDMGITVAVDDFGTGYSSLSYLKKFPIDTLKIDRSFIDEIATSENDVAIVKAIMVLAETMGLNVVAEGIETLEQLKILHDFGCQHIQGYFFSKPLPNDDFVEFVEEHFFEHKAMWKLEVI